MLKIAICEDESTHLEFFQTSLKNYWREKDEFPELQIFSAAEDLLSAPYTYDILFLDLGLGQNDGLQAALQLRERGYTGIIIITTAMAYRSLEGYKADVFRFLVKPYNQIEFNEALLAAIRHLQTGRYVVEVFFNGERFFLPIRDIIYIESYYQNIYITMSDRQIKVSLTWAQMMERLPRDLFCFVQKSFCINFHHLKSHRSNTVVMSDGKTLSVSAKYRQEFDAAVLRYKERLMWESKYTL